MDDTWDIFMAKEPQKQQRPNARFFKIVGFVQVLATYSELFSDNRVELGSKALIAVSFTSINRRSGDSTVQCGYKDTDAQKC